MKKLIIVFGSVALLLGTTELLMPASADAASARSTASSKRPDAGKRVKAPGRKTYTTRLTSRKAAANRSKKRSRQQEGKSATSKRNAGTFQPVAVTWRDARRAERQASAGFGFTVQKRSRGGRSVTFRDQRGTVASEVAPRLQRWPDGVARQRSQ